MKKTSENLGKKKKAKTGNSFIYKVARITIGCVFSLIAVGAICGYWWLGNAKLFNSSFADVGAIFGLIAAVIWLGCSFAAVEFLLPGSINSCIYYEDEKN